MISFFSFDQSYSLILLYLLLVSEISIILYPNILGKAKLLTIFIEWSRSLNG